MTANEIRSKFLEFFKSKGHIVFASDSLVPKGDPTVLFTTAGMQQFKKQFLGQIDGYSRAVSSQKCLRTDDLGQVGKTPYHHTFFEMLGNFSFGDYFKKEAITWGWEFLTKSLKIPKDKLWVSVYQEDIESYQIWVDHISVPRDKVVKLGDKSNFWPAEAKEKGPNGPCGPCSEIFYDYGPKAGCGKPDCTPACNCARFSEIWNLVFTQFDRKEDGTLRPLPHKNIDTGMGLERLVAVMQSKKSNFETDLFVPILNAIDEEIQKQHLENFPHDLELIIADHIRAVVFAINDGIIPSNKERGSVVKRLIFDITDMILRYKGNPFAHKLVPLVVEIMKDPYPELSSRSKDISIYIKKTQDDYQKVFRTRIPEFQNKIKKALSIIPNTERCERYGKLMFDYRDTYGLTLSTIMLTMDKLGIDAEDKKLARTIYEKYMHQQQERSRASSKMSGDVFVNTALSLDDIPKTEFSGYEETLSEATILKIFREDQLVKKAEMGDYVKIILNKTPFYAEAGGQIGDTGVIIGSQGKATIKDTQQISDVYIHMGVVKEGSLEAKEQVRAQIDLERRLSIMRNHTATHLLQTALRTILGSHVQQQGSLVANDRFRFDFTHPNALTKKQIREIEDFVNKSILSCARVTKENLSIQEAKKMGALAFFAEKYGETVRVVSIDGYSKEFCGGTHLDSTGQIGLFKIIDECAIAQGIRRIEAVTGTTALDFVRHEELQLEKIAQTLKAPKDELVQRIEIQTKRLKETEKELGQLKLDVIKGTLEEVAKNSESIKKSRLVHHRFKNIPPEILRKIADILKQKTESAVIVLCSQMPNHAVVLINVTDDLVKKDIKANDIIKEIAPIMNGNGGGRPQMAQAGSKEVAQLDKAFRKAVHLAKDKLSI